MTPREWAMSWMTPAERVEFMDLQDMARRHRGTEVESAASNLAIEIVVWASQRYELVVLRQQLTSPPRSLDVAH